MKVRTVFGAGIVAVSLVYPAFALLPSAPTQSANATHPSRTEFVLGKMESVLGGSSEPELVPVLTPIDADGYRYRGDYQIIDEDLDISLTVTVGPNFRTLVSRSHRESGSSPLPDDTHRLRGPSVARELPTIPQFTGDATPADLIGVSVTGDELDASTSHSVTCDSGETYELEQIDHVVDIDRDHSEHVEHPAEGLDDPIHLLPESLSTASDLVHIGFALDGHMIYSSRSGAYTSSYVLATESRQGTNCQIDGPEHDVFNLVNTQPDGTYSSDWVYQPDAGTLDECNGAVVEGEYVYFVTPKYPFAPRCLNGVPAPNDGLVELREEADIERAPPPEWAADLAGAAESLDVDVETLLEALGPPPANFEDAASRLGVDPEQLRSLLRPSPVTS